MRERVKDREWERMQSSLAKISKDATYEECRKYACEDIANKLTYIQKQDIPFIVEIPKGTEFHFIGRVDTNTIRMNIPEAYYQKFEDRNFVAFSTISKKNISHYKGRVFFVYDILPEDIVHVFPLDSDTLKDATTEDSLTYLPSLWITLEELEEMTEKLEVYNQVTCKTKRNGKLIKPFAVIAFEQIDENIKKIAEEFGIGCIIIHPDSDAINYTKDLLYDYFMLKSVSQKMEKACGLNLEWMFYLD